MSASAAVVTALRVEQEALRNRLAPVPALRIGMGRRAVPRLLPLAAERSGLLLAGLAGGLAPQVRPGDLVVADAVVTDAEIDGRVGTDGARRTPLPSAPLLTAALRRLGLRVHVGAIASADGIVHGARRSELARTGALAVDMESGPLVEAARAVDPQLPLAVVRVVVDTAEHPLLRPGTAGRGLAALRALRVAAPALRQWAQAVQPPSQPRSVVLADPRSFCAGVERAIDIVRRALDRYGAPVYVRRQIVHNTHVVRDLQSRGAVFVSEVDEVPVGGTAVLAAHGVSPQVRADAESRGLRVIDATCPLVAKVHSEVKRYASRGDSVFLIGHRDHEEVEGTRGEAPSDVLVVEDEEQAAVVRPRDPERVAYVMQTTLAVDDADRIADVLRRRFPSLAGPRRDDICYATTNRQTAVRGVAAASDLVLVVGSGNSSNSRRLVEVAERAGSAAHLVEDASEVDLAWLAGAQRVGITAGASAPPRLVDEVVQCLRGFGPLSVSEPRAVEENVRFTLPREVS